MTDQSATTLEKPPGQDPAGTEKKTPAVLGRIRPTNLVFFAVAVIFVVVAALTNDSFFTTDNLTNILSQMVTTGLLSLGMLMVILTGGIDLSVGAIVSLTGIMSAGLVAGMPLPLAILLAILVGAGCGIVNGILVAHFRMAPFVVTLAAMTAFGGLTYVYSKVPITPDNLGFLTLGAKNIGVIPLSAIITVVLFGLGWIFLNRTAAGRALLGIGGNEEAVRLAGVNVRNYLILAYVISGVCAGIAGVILASRVGIAQPNVGSGFELDAIAACVIGGAALSGGRGTIGGALGGVVLLGLIDNLLSLYDVESYWQQVLKGVIIAVAILVRRREQRGA
ncbi:MULTISPECIES: ABC transporter permease [unclassified Streptomyces]|uniref:ABC transporter permease n=1 Tax=unclassified Streptomyces TaxID=2593676 RepID=UPI002E28A0CE|nr:ABC transporter permease [Streptomyces sp. NBC_00223]